MPACGENVSSFHEKSVLSIQEKNDWKTQALIFPATFGTGIKIAFES